MLFIEFPIDLKDGLNIIKYRNVNDDNWYYLHINIETLNLLTRNYGVISTYKIPTEYTNSDNPTTSEIINVKYCGADIQLFCSGKKNTFNLQLIEQNY